MTSTESMLRQQVQRQREMNAEMAAAPAAGVREAALRLYLFQCLTELSYVQSVENCHSGLCATPMGEELIEKGMKLLGVPSLHERYEQELKRALAGAAQPAPSVAQEWKAVVAAKRAAQPAPPKETK